MKKLFAVILCLIAIFMFFSISEAQAKKQIKQVQVPIAQQVNFLGDKNSMKYHYPSCRKAPKGENSVPIDSPMTAKRSGFKPCKTCKPIR